MELRQMGAAGQEALAWARAWRLARWLQQILGTAEPLEQSVRRQMEGYLGRSLEDVRIHDSQQAGEVARRLGAEAFAIGSRIFADRGKLNPETVEGLGLLAHELTHVVQQTQPQPLAPRAPAGESIPRQKGGQQASGERAQFARYLPPSSSPVEQQMEAEAQASEQAVLAAQRGGKTAETAAPETDVDELADMVYRLMRHDLILERERMSGVK